MSPYTILLLICTLSRREKPNDYKLVEGKNLATIVSNQLHHLMTIFGNFINQGVASHRKIKTLRYLSLRSSVHQQESQPHKGMDKRKVKIISRVLDPVKFNFPKTTQFIEDCLEQECSKENISLV